MPAATAPFPKATPEGGREEKEKGGRPWQRMGAQAGHAGRLLLACWTPLCAFCLLHCGQDTDPPGSGLSGCRGAPARGGGDLGEPARHFLPLSFFCWAQGSATPLAPLRP